MKRRSGDWAGHHGVDIVFHQGKYAGDLDGRMCTVSGGAVKLDCSYLHVPAGLVVIIERKACAKSQKNTAAAKR